MTKKYLYQVVYYQAVTAYNKAYSVIRVFKQYFLFSLLLFLTQ